MDKKHRFRGQKGVVSVLRFGRRTQTGRGIIVRTLEHKGLAREGRIAVIVSKKTAKRAVVRNRIRRRVFAYVRENKATLLHGRDLVITVMDESFAEISWSVFCAQFEGALQGGSRGIVYGTKQEKSKETV